MDSYAILHNSCSSLLKPHHLLQFIEAINGEYVVDYHLQKDLQFIFL